MNRELTEETKPFELLFETAAEGFVITNSRGCIERVNQTACKMFGYTREEMTGLQVEALLPEQLVSHHHKHREGFVKNPHQRPMGQGLDLRGRKKDGETFPLEISLNHFNEEGEVKVMALIMDITQRKTYEERIKSLNLSLEKKVQQRTAELKESQRLYNLIARNYPRGTINVFDKDLRYVFAEGQEMYKSGVTSDHLVGKPYLDFLPDEIRPIMRTRLETVLNGENHTFELELNEEWYLINTVGLEAEDGSIEGILLVEQNISDRKTAETKLEQALEKEQQLSELKSRFVSMASHEFRTPLSSILSSLSLLERYDDDKFAAKRPKHYKRIRSSVRHLTNILNDFLSLEKVESGNVGVNFSRFNLEELVTEIVSQVKQITKKDQKIQFRYNGPSEVVADQNMLQVICNNLLSNAIKYSNEGKIIDVAVSTTAKDTVIRVKDQGIGIPLDEQEHLFERFFRARNATNIEGTGLGLNIVSRYLKMLGGHIDFESVPDEGTTFFVTIPNQPNA